MIIKPNGEPARKQVIAQLVIFVSNDGGESWMPLKPVKVPAWLKDDPDVLGALVNGHMCCCPNDSLKWYRAEKLSEERLH